MKRAAAALLVLTVVALRPPPTAAAQTARAAVSGVVTDAANAPLPTVTVSLTSVDTGLERRIVTDADGTFVIGGLTPGPYVIRVQEDAFAAYAGEPFTMQAGE